MLGTIRNVLVVIFIQFRQFFNFLISFSVHFDEVELVSGDSTSLLLVGGETSVPRDRGSRPSLVRALGKSFWRVLLISAVFKLVQDLLSFVSPQLLK